MDALEATSYGAKPTFSLILSKDDAAKVQLGRDYEVVFKPVFERRGKQLGLLLEVSSVSPLLFWRSQLGSRGISIPGSIYRIFQDRRSSPWSFLLTLAYLVGAESSPRGFLHKLKLILLLSLVSGPSRDKIHVLAVGEDINMLSRYSWL